MPTIAHAILGGAIAFIFYYITNYQNKNSDKVFTERMVVLFAFNSFIGPDIFTLFYAFNLNTDIIPIKSFQHSILGWPIWCLGIMWIWYYIINLRSTELTRISKSSILLLLVAAGEIHFFLDMLDDGVNLIAFGALGIHLTLQNNFLIGNDYQYGPLHNAIPWFSMTEMFFIGLIFLILLIYSLFRWQLKYTSLIASIFLGVIVLCYLLIGSYVVGFENDFGVTLYFGGLLLLPIVLMILAMKEKNPNPN